MTESFGHLVARADADIRMGTGHLMRCLALAQAWKERGGKVTFLSRLEIPALRERIGQEGFEFLALSRSHPEPEDLQNTLDYLLTRQDTGSSVPGRADWLVLDGYHFTLDFQQAVRRSPFKLLVVDDYRHLAGYEADILLNQNIFAPKLDYCCNDDAVKLLGYNYALLRREFWPYRGRVKEIPERARKVLVTMGGGDPDNVTLKVIKALNRVNVSGLQVKIIVGSANPNIQILHKELALAPYAHDLLTNVSDMPAQMAWADLAISAGGSTCWELCFMGVPTLIIVAADNQREVGAGLKEAQVARCLGWHEAASVELISGEFKELLGDKRRRASMSARGRELVDGNGVNRILRAMLFGEIRLRPVGAADSYLLWGWANDSYVREAAFNFELIDWETHSDWFAKKLLSRDCQIFIGEGRNEIPFGQIRFDLITDSLAEIDYSVDRRFRLLGLGSDLVLKGIESFAANHPIPMTFQAKVKLENEISNHIFKKVGFSSKYQEGFIIYRLSPPREAEV